MHKMTLADRTHHKSADTRVRAKLCLQMNAQLSSDITDMRIEQMDDKATRKREQSEGHRSGRSD